MRRIIGTILAANNARTPLVHDDQTGEFFGRLANGVEEPLSDWTNSTDPEVARQAAIAWYRTRATFDPWQLRLADEEAMLLHYLAGEPASIWAELGKKEERVVTRCGEIVPHNTATPDAGQVACPRCRELLVGDESTADAIDHGITPWSNHVFCYKEVHESRDYHRACNGGEYEFRMYTYLFRGRVIHEFHGCSGSQAFPYNHEIGSFSDAPESDAFWRRETRIRRLEKVGRVPTFERRFTADGEPLTTVPGCAEA